MRADKSCTMKLKLSMITLLKFNGEVTRFQSSRESFKSAVNNNLNLSPIDKFNYLNALLEGSAACSIQGLMLLEANYVAAIQILKERFRKKKQIISTPIYYVMQSATGM